jgi:hypothetical protein
MQVSSGRLNPQFSRKPSSFVFSKEWGQFKSAKRENVKDIKLMIGLNDRLGCIQSTWSFSLKAAV